MTAPICAVSARAAREARHARRREEVRVALEVEDALRARRAGSRGSWRRRPGPPRSLCPRCTVKRGSFGSRPRADDVHRDAVRRRRDRCACAWRARARPGSPGSDERRPRSPAGPLPVGPPEHGLPEALLEPSVSEHDDVVAAVDGRIVGQREDAVDEVVVGVLQRAGERRAGGRHDDVAGVLLERYSDMCGGRRVVADDRGREAQQPLDRRHARRASLGDPVARERHDRPVRLAGARRRRPGTGRNPRRRRWSWNLAMPPQSCE